MDLFKASLKWRTQSDQWLARSENQILVFNVSYTFKHERTVSLFQFKSRKFKKKLILFSEQDSLFPAKRPPAVFFSFFGGKKHAQREIIKKVNCIAGGRRLF